LTGNTDRPLTGEEVHQGITNSATGKKYIKDSIHKKRVFPDPAEKSSLDPAR
jgi:hypothetical protein